MFNDVNSQAGYVWECANTDCLDTSFEWMWNTHHILSLCSWHRPALCSYLDVSEPSPVHIMHWMIFCFCHSHCPRIAFTTSITCILRLYLFTIHYIPRPYPSPVIELYFSPSPFPLLSLYTCALPAPNVCSSPQSLFIVNRKYYSYLHSLSIQYSPDDYWLSLSSLLITPLKIVKLYSFFPIAHSRNFFNEKCKSLNWRGKRMTRK